MKTFAKAITGILFALVFAIPVWADYLYTFNLGELTYNSVTYPASSFSFSTTNILDATGDSASISGQTVNGFSPATITVNLTPTFAFYTNFDFSTAVGEVGGLQFLQMPNPTDVGYYPTTYAGRMISTGSGLLGEYTSGSLTISSVPSAIPEPTSLFLLSTGLGTIILTAVCRKRRKL